MTPNIMSLSRTEVAHVAAVVEHVRQAHGGTTEAAARVIHVSGRTLRSVLARPAALDVTRPILAAIAAAAGEGVTVEDLLAGRVRLKAPPVPLRTARPRMRKVYRGPRPC